MPLRKINKIIASNVIKGFKINDNPVFRELAPESAVKFNASDEISIADTIINLNKMEKLDYSLYLEKFKTDYAAEMMYSLYTSLVS